MNLEPKILLTINLEGVLSQVKEDVIINVVEEKRIPTGLFEKGEPMSMALIKRYDVTHQQRVPGIAVKKTTITVEAYNTMTDKQTPEWYKPRRNQGKQWESLSKDEKLNSHFKRISYPNTFTFTYIDE